MKKLFILRENLNFLSNMYKTYIEEEKNVDRGIFKEVPLPCAFLDEVALERNIQSIIELSGNKKIRIASKSLRSVPIMKKILAANHRFQGIMCFSPRSLVLNRTRV